MGKTIRQAEIKRAVNAEYAAQFPEKDAALRRKQRRQRRKRVELRWLESMGIERDKGRPLI